MVIDGNGNLHCVFTSWVSEVMYTMSISSFEDPGWPLTKDVVTKRLNIARSKDMDIGSFGEVAKGVDKEARKLCKKHFGVELPYFRASAPDYNFYSYEQFIALRNTLREMKKKNPFDGKD